MVPDDQPPSNNACDHSSHSQHNQPPLSREEITRDFLKRGLKPSSLRIFFRNDSLERPAGSSADHDTAILSVKQLRVEAKTSNGNRLSESNRSYERLLLQVVDKGCVCVRLGILVRGGQRS